MSSSVAPTDPSIARPATGIRSQQTADVRSVDREVLLLLRGNRSLGVGELMDRLNVTATAVRQRIERLLQMGLIAREKIVAGRGRPTYRYRLTVAGHQSAGANPAELANAMWQTILAVPDARVRRELLSAVAARLGQHFAAQMASSMAEGDEEFGFGQRMEQLSEMLAARQIASEVSREGQLPVLDVGCCPYPSLTDESDERAMCRLEEQIFSEALGQPVELSSCRLDGDQCCQFTPVSVGGSEKSGVSDESSEKG